MAVCIRSWCALQQLHVGYMHMYVAGVCICSATTVSLNFTHMHTCTLSHMHTLSLTHAHMYPLTHAHTLSHTHMCTHTHTQVRFHPINHCSHSPLAHLKRHEQITSGYPLLSPTGVTMAQAVIGILYHLQEREPWNRAIGQVRMCRR